MTTSVRLPVWSGISLCLVALMLAACRRAEEQPAETARPAKLFTVQSAAALSAREFPGVIRAFDEAEISFLVAGRIVKLPVKESEQLEKGALIAQLDDRDFVSALNAARAQLTLQLTQYNSSSNLYSKGVISRDEFDQKSRDLAVARSEFEQAQKTLDDSVLRAPYAGRVARRYAEEGQSIQVKQPIILLQDVSRLKLTVNLPEQLVARSSATPLEEVIKNVQAVAKLPALRGRTFDLTLHEFSTTADPDTRTYAATFTFPTPADAVIMPGMTASVSAKRQPGEGAAAPIFVPVTAVFKAPDGSSCVWCVNTNDMTLQRRAVSTGELSGSSIEISSGIGPGDTIVAAGTAEFQEGQRIQPYRSL